MSENNRDLLAGIFIGALIGVTLGLLFAPKSGKETREDIARNADELLAKAKEGYEKSAEMVTKSLGVESYREGNSEEIV